MAAHHYERFTMDSLPDLLNGPLTSDVLDSYLAALEKRSLLLDELKRVLLLERSATPTVAVISTFFSSMVTHAAGGYTYDRFRRMVSNKNVFEKDYILIPTFVSSRQHWALTVIDMAAHQIKWYDSKFTNNQVNDDGFTEIVARQWLSDEAQASNIIDSDSIESWPIMMMTDGPMEASDVEYSCGMLTMITATFIANGVPLDQITQSSIRNFKLTVAEALLLASR